MIPIHVLNSIVNVLTIRGNQGCFNIGISCDEIVENTINEFYPLIKGSWSVMDIRDKRGRPINIFGRIYDYHWVLCLNVLGFGTVVLEVVSRILCKLQIRGKIEQKYYLRGRSNDRLSCLQHN